MKIKFNKVTAKEDIKLLVKVANKAWNDHYLPIIGKEQVTYMLDKFQSETAISRQIESENYTYFLIFQNENAVGYFGIQPQNEYLFLSKLYVLKEYQKQGIASQVISFLKNMQEKPIQLTVNKQNKSSIAVYQHWGFTIIDDIVTDIGSGFVMDDYVMELKR